MRSGAGRANGRWMGRVRGILPAWVALALAAAGCGDEAPDDAHPDRGDITTSFRAAPEPVSAELAESFQDTRLFEELADALNQLLKLPSDLPVAHVSCGEPNAFWDPERRQLSMCYELLTAIAQQAYDPSLSRTELGERIVGPWMFVFFHELGHGLVDLYDLPTTGREEDAVDDFSSLLLIELGLAEYAVRAADFWATTELGATDERAYADEHSLNAQRFYSILCLVFGSDPDRYEALVSEGFLPESRAVRCPSEYQTKRSAWDQLLTPWAKP